MSYSCLYLCADHPCRVVYLAAYANIWVYPFLAKMPPVMMSLFFAGCYVISLILYFGGMLLSYIRYGSESTCVSTTLSRQCSSTTLHLWILWAFIRYVHT